MFRLSAPGWGFAWPGSPKRGTRDSPLAQRNGQLALASTMVVVSRNLSKIGQRFSGSDGAPPIHILLKLLRVSLVGY